MSVAGIDFSSFQADIVILDEDSDAATHHVFAFGKGDAFDRARTIRYSMPSRSWWDDQGCLAVGIEDPRGAARNVDSILYRVQGALLVCLPQRLLVQPWKPGEWRKQLGISNVGKEAPFNYAVDHWPGPRAFLTQDAADAYCLATATRQRIVIGSRRRGRKKDSMSDDQTEKTTTTTETTTPAPEPVPAPDETTTTTTTTETDKPDK